MLNWEKAFDYWTEVYNNTEPAVQRGYGTPMELLASGEAGLFLYSSWGSGMGYKEKGAPLEFVSATPVTTYRAYVIPKDAPHPNAARLLADFMTTPEVELIITDIGWASTLSPEAAEKAKANKYIREAGIEPIPMPLELMTEENFKKSSDFWFTLLGLK